LGMETSTVAMGVCACWDGGEEKVVRPLRRDLPV
jgi:hypothetical protein